MYLYSVQTSSGLLELVAESHFCDDGRGKWYFYGQDGGESAIVARHHFQWFTRHKLEERSEPLCPCATSEPDPGLLSDNAC